MRRNGDRHIPKQHPRGDDSLFDHQYRDCLRDRLRPTVSEYKWLIPGRSNASSAKCTYITNIGTCGGASPTLPCTFTYSKAQNVSSEAMVGGFNFQGVSVTGNTITNNNQVNSLAAPVGVNAGIAISAGEPDTLLISGNTITDTQATPTQTYGISINSLSLASWAVNPYHLSITSNDLNGNGTAPILDATASTTKVIANNDGVDNVIPSVASATTLAFPFNPTISLTGTTTVTGISGPAWTGRQVTMLPTGIVAFTATNNIANALSTAANIPTCRDIRR